MTETPLLGRARELAQLSAALDEARAGSGSVCFVCGEPGIGKSRLTEELARVATRSGMDVLWGRAWEAGGAPAYWPWIQVLRALVLGPDGEGLLRDAPATRLAPLAALLPELQPRAPAPLDAAPLAPEHARFALLDAASALLLEAGRRRARLIVLEDLHAADPASVELLDFLSGQARSVAMAVVGTYREVDAARAPCGPLLQRVTGRSYLLPLRRLAREDVASQLELATGSAPSEELVAAVHGATEGNPLFVVETARLIAARGAPAGRVAIPGSVRAAIRERLARLLPGTRGVLALAAVIGRDFRRTTLARMSGEPGAELAVPLADAVDAAVLLEVAPGQYRFAHILFREVLYQDLEPVRREALHLALAQGLEHDAERAPQSELAHHYLEAGAAGSERAVECATLAAEQAQEQFAFGEAARLLSLALGALPRDGRQGDARSSELLLALGRAQVLAGEQALGQASCAQAAERARARGDAALLARAALAYGSVFVVGRVDPVLVELLQEARAALPAGEVALRARVLARLAAAQQPASDPNAPIALAREAIALARAHGDAFTLLDVIRAGCSAMIDFGDPAERLALNREHVALAQQLGDRVELLRGTVRMVFDCYELGDVSAARAAVDRAERIAGELGHPHYAWRIACLQAMRASFAGDFAQSDRELERARDLGARAGDPNVPRSLLLQRVYLLRQQARNDELFALLPEVRREFAGEALTAALLELIAQSARARVGEPLDAPDTAIVDLALSFGDQSLFECAAEVCHLLGDCAASERALPHVRARRERFAHSGMFGMTWDGPMTRALALLHATLGHAEEAERCFEQALACMREAGSRTHLCWVASDYGRFLHARGERERAAELLAVARSLAHELDMPALARSLPALREASLEAQPSAALAAGLPRVDFFRMQREGELWLIDSGASRIRVRDGKGLRILAELVREPGRELHVLELAEPGGASDTGDAGELLDARARSEYGARIASLRAEIAEAEEQNDLGRAEHSRRELELLSQELARAVGLGGKDRRSGAAAERARVNVQRRLRDAIRRIGEQDAELAKHLEWAVHTGTFCSYAPR
jgi:hypothetical protein